jgi:hypothetical protein
VRPRLPVDPAGQGRAGSASFTELEILLEVGESVAHTLSEGPTTIAEAPAIAESLINLRLFIGNSLFVYRVIDNVLAVMS